jgi:DNA-binding IclR family transcriptional regulator
VSQTLTPGPSPAGRGEHTANDQTIGSLARGLRLMDVLWEHFAVGMTSGEVARAAKESPSYATRALKTLESVGWVERVPETERWRPSVRAARRLGSVKRAMDTQEQRSAELRARVGTDL